MNKRNSRKQKESSKGKQYKMQLSRQKKNKKNWVRGKHNRMESR